MDLDTEFRRRQLALQQSSPSIRTIAAPQTTKPISAPITAANLPAPVIAPVPQVQTVQKTQTPTTPNGFSFKQRADKGFDFFDPSGNKTTIENYTKNTGVNGSDLRQGLAQAGDPVSQKIVATPQPQAQAPKQDKGFWGNIGDALASFGSTIRNNPIVNTLAMANPITALPALLNNIPNVPQQARDLGGGLVDTANFATRIPQTIDTAKNQAEVGLDNLLGLKDEAAKANARGELTTKSYNDIQKAIQDFSNTVTGKKGTSNEDTTREANNILDGKSNPGEVFDAIVKSLSLASTVPVGKGLAAAKGEFKIGDDLAKSLPAEDLKAIEEAGGNIANTAKTTSKQVDEVAPLPTQDQAAIKAAGGDVPTAPAVPTTPQVADTVLHLPSLGVHAKLTPAQADILKNEVDNIPFSATDRPHLTAGQKVLDSTKEVSADEIGNLSPNAKLALENANKQIEVKAAQTGTSDLAKAETTSPDLAQADISAKASDEAISAEKAAQPEDIASQSDSGQNLLPAVADTTKNAKSGEGFVTSDKAHPQIQQITTRLNQIDNKLSSVAEGKTTLSREQITALKSERDDLINSARQPFDNPEAKITTPNTKGAPTTAPVGAKSAAETFPDATPDDQKAIQQVMDQLRPAQREANKKIKSTAQDKAARINKGEAVYDQAGGGEEGFRAKLGSLKGKYQDGNYTPISVDPKIEKHLLDRIEKSDLRSFEKLNTQNALRKLWGANPEKPTSSDVTYVKNFFNKEFGPGTGDELAGGINQALKEGQSIEDVVSNIAGLPRALMATGDLSGGFRQALPLGTRFPLEWANANKESVRYALQPKYFEKEMKRLGESDSYSTITDKMGIDLPGISGVQDEGFIGAGYAEKIPVAKIAVKAADRAYTGVLTRLRYDVANKLIEKEGGVDKFLNNMRETYGEASVKRGLFGGKQIPKDERAMRALGEVINTFTGRGGMKGGLLDEHMKTASTLLFAPRLWAANLSRLNPGFYARLARDNPKAAKLALQSQGTFLSVAGLTLGLASAAGASVGMDPRSADFGKIKVGNTRYDIMGGQQQNIVLLSRLLTGQKVNSETGEVVDLGKGYGTKSRVDLGIDMFNNKSNPLLAFGLRLLNSSTDSNGNLVDEFGKPYSPVGDAAGLVTPLGIQGTGETIGDTNSIPKGILMNVPSFFGVGVQTYGTTPTYEQGTKDTTTSKITFKGKVAPDMVTDAQGNVITDTKGNPVKVTINSDSTPASIAADKTKKAGETLRANFVANQTKEDQTLMGLNSTQLAQQVSSGSITKDHADKIDSLNAQATNAGSAGITGVQSGPAKKFYETYNAKSSKEQKAWLAGPADDNAKTIADQVNAQKSSGLDDFKPSNNLSKLYSDYEKDILAHPEYTTIDKQNKAKAFQASAEKTNYSTDQQDIYTEGGSDDLTNLIDNGQVSKADLDSAIDLDNKLYKSGVTSSLKFSKKFRGLYGYPMADGSASGSGSGSSLSLTSFLPSKTSSGGAKPTFSSSPRNKKISFGTTLPKKSSKKISIKL